jgi:hypothetical protein
MNLSTTTLSNPTVTMTSIEMVAYINSFREEGEAELRHDTFMVKVPKVLGEEVSKKFWTPYVNVQNGQTYKIYIFPKREACLMAMSYSYDLQAKVFDKMTELESQVVKPVSTLPDFTNAAQAARAWADAHELAQTLAVERDKAIETKAEIGSRREATAMNTASQAKKQVAKLEVELDKSKEYSTIKRMESIYLGQQFNWRLLKIASIEINLPSVDVYDANYGTVKSYHADVWRKAYGLSVES